MDVPQHSTVREGAVTGVIGGVILAVWYFIVDTAAGAPLHTPNMLGRMLFGARLRPPGAYIDTGAVIGYTLVHFVLFILIGMGLALLVHLAIRNTSLRMGVWFGLLITFAFFAGHVYMLGLASGERIAPWSVIAGSLLSVLGMAGYLWRHHPQLSRSFHEEPLGSEVPPPPHPPERPRAA
jgi:hypothetical protein